MKSIEDWLTEYGESHQNSANKRIHWLCVPLILFSILGFFIYIPFPIDRTWWLNWGGLSILLAFIFYWRLSKSLAGGFVVVALGMLILNWWIYTMLNSSKINALTISLFIFVIAWLGQFYGHKLEGKKPSFFKDIQFLLIGPIWLLVFIYRKFNIEY